MKQERTPFVILGLAALVAVGAPTLLLMPRQVATPAARPAGPSERMQPIVVPDAPQMGDIVARKPFGDAKPQATPTPEAVDEGNEGPDLAGIVGRFPRHASAMVRIGRGKTRTLSPGQSIDGWKLVSLTPTRATFRRGDRRVVRRVN